MNIRKYRQDFLRAIGLIILPQVVDILCKSLKVTIKNKEVINKFDDEKKNFILAFWHGQMLLAWYLHRNKNFTALISKSRDGDLLEKILKHWKYNVIRGSSSKGGDIALGIMIDNAQNNKSIAITPDGPTGPINKMKAGVVVTSKKSNTPLILLGIGYKNKRVLGSWDKFEIPKFYSGANAVYSDPVYVYPDLSFEDTSELILKCERKLNELQLEANNFGNH